MTSLIKVIAGGVVQLEDGKRYKIRVTKGQTSKIFEGTATNLPISVVKALNESRVAFRDLKNTRITSEGIKTDQSKQPIVKYEHYNDRYAEITKAAIPIIESTPSIVKKTPSAAGKEEAEEEEETEEVDMDHKKVNFDLPPEKTNVDLSFAQREIAPIAYNHEKTEQIETVAQSNLEKVSNFFKTIGNKIKSVMIAVKNKVVDFFNRKEPEGTRKTEEPTEDLNPVLVEEPDDVLDSVATREEKKIDRVMAEIDRVMATVTLEDIDRVMARVVQTQEKPKVRDGEFRAGSRKMGPAKRTGKGKESHILMQNMLRKLENKLNELNGLNPPEGQPFALKTTIQALSDLDTIESIMKAINATEWGQGVLASDPVSKKLLESLKTFELRNKFEGKQVELLSQGQVWETLINPAEQSQSFRKQYLMNYRVYRTSEDFFNELMKKYANRAYLALQLNDLEEDSEGNVTFDVPDGSTKNKNALLRQINQEQQSILALCKEWLSDPFINNGECQEGNPIYIQIAQILYIAKKGGQNVDAIYQLLKKPVGVATLQTGQPIDALTAQILAVTNNTFGGRKRNKLLNQMAEDVSKMDQYLFSQITSAELVKQGWSKKEKEEKAPNILASIAQFNNFSSYVKSCIIGLTATEGGDDKMKNRARLVEFFIDLMVKLIEKNDFNCAQSIFGGLSDSSINRLNNTLELVSPDHLAKMEDARKLLSHEKNFKVIREKYSGLAKSGTPYVPYLGTILSDYTFVDDANPKMSEEGDLVHNTMKLLNKPVRAVKTPQELIAREAAKDPDYFRMEYDLLHLEGAIVTDAELYRLSLLIQPRT